MKTAARTIEILCWLVLIGCSIHSQHIARNALASAEAAHALLDQSIAITAESLQRELALRDRLWKLEDKE